MDNCMTADERLDAVAKLFCTSKRAVALACSRPGAVERGIFFMRQNVRQPATALGAAKHNEAKRKRGLRDSESKIAPGERITQRVRVVGRKIVPEKPAHAEKAPRLPYIPPRPTLPSFQETFGPIVQANPAPERSNAGAQAIAKPTQDRPESPTSARLSAKARDLGQALPSDATTDRRETDWVEICRQALEYGDSDSDYEADKNSDEGKDEDDED